eukprot:Pgem_evm1s11959
MMEPNMPLRPDWVLYLFLDNVADVYEPVVDSAEAEIDAIDEVIFYLSDSDQSDVLRRLGVARKRMSLLTNKLKFKRDILMYLTTQRKTGNYVHHSTH